MGPPPPLASFPLELPAAVVEVGVFSRSGGPVLAGAVELVSPANKDRPAHREALVSKCAAYLQSGVGLVLVDVVTDRSGDLHRELLARVGAGDPGPGPSLSGSAYRPVDRDGAAALDVWREPLAVGQRLPTLPLWLRGGLCLPVELEATYRAPAWSSGCNPRRSASGRGTARRRGPGPPCPFPARHRLFSAGQSARKNFGPP